VDGPDDLEGILAVEGNGPHGTLDGVGVELDATILDALDLDALRLTLTSIPRRQGEDAPLTKQC
jgi:hypothetical protein